MLSANDISNILEGVWFVDPIDYFTPRRVETDSRKDCQEVIFVAFAGENFDAHNYLEEVVDKGAKILIVEVAPSESTIHIALDKGCAILKVLSTVLAYQEMGSYMLEKNNKCKVIGITGSSGKTSTKSVLAHLLEQVAPQKVLATVGNTNNHIGVPQNLLRMTGNEEFAVLEMGTNHPGEIGALARIAPGDVAVITSIGDSHCGHFDPVDGILREKSDIVVHMKESGTAVVPYGKLADIMGIGALLHKKYFSFGSSSEADFQVIYHGGNFTGSSFTVKQKGGEEVRYKSSLTGRHQAENCGACLAVLVSLGYKLSQFEKSFENVSLPGMRMKLSEIEGVRFLNDAYNANPQSMQAFFDWLNELEKSESFLGQKYVVVGDMLELGDRSMEFHTALYANLPKSWQAVAVGEFGCLVSQNDSVNKRPYFADSKMAADYLAPLLKVGDTVALKGSRGIHLEEIIEKFKEKK